MKLDNSVAAVVTGGASGLGAATARALAARGVKVAIFDLNAKAGEAMAREIGGVFCEVNVTDDAGSAKARTAHGPEQVQDALAAMVPFPKRLGKAEEYAKLAPFMIGHDYLNGELIRFDGAVRIGPK
ncbi:MAG: SDR family oxidoreductase [Novosphingobium sp.]